MGKEFEKDQKHNPAPDPKVEGQEEWVWTLPPIKDACGSYRHICNDETGEPEIYMDC